MSDWYAAQCRWKMAQDRYIAISAIQMILRAQLPSVLRENVWLLDVVPELSYTGLMLWLARISADGFHSHLQATFSTSCRHEGE